MHVDGIMRVCQRLNSFHGNFVKHRNNHTDKYWIMITNLFLNKCLHCGVENSCK
jgi:hypothetical protein